MGKGRRTWPLLVLAAATVCGGVVAAPRASAASGTPEPTWAPHARYRLIFDDEFNGTTLGKDWTPGWLGTGTTAPVNSLEEAAYTSADVTVRGGSLNLTLTPTRAPVIVGANIYFYKGALVTTRGHFTFTYGYVEWRAYLPESASGQIADWPALWAVGTGTYPDTGEMDVMEGLGGDAAWHFISPSGSFGASTKAPMYGWHTFGAAWQPGTVTYYYDGQEVGTVTTGITGAPMFLVMDNTIAGMSPPASSYPAVMRVDWVRVWS